MSTIAPFYSGGTGESLVLLHGLTCSWRIWRPVVPALEKHHAVFAPALAGHNGGGAVEVGGCGMSELADAAERSMDSAGIGRAHLVGNSVGGWLALELARRGRADTLVLLSPAGAWRSARDLARVVRMLDVGHRLAKHGHRWSAGLLGRPAVRRIVLRGFMEHGDRVPLRAAEEIIEDVVAAAAVPGFIEWIRQVEGAGHGEQLGVPVRLAWAERDRTISFSRYGRPYLDLLPEAELVMLAGCGHVPMYDDPELVARTILEVTTGSGRAAGSTRRPPSPARPDAPDSHRPGPG